MSQPVDSRTVPEREGQPLTEQGRAGAPPSHIGRYRIEKLLGEGGFGRVYLARDEQLQRWVAVKMPHPYLVLRPEDIEVYVTEARIIANLDHPHIVPVYDIGSTAECPCFIVSKYIEGSTLTMKIKDRRPSFGEAMELVATIAETLHYAHRQGLVHRDIKPSNILLDVQGQPFVVDFGLALREEQIGHGPKYAGTPAYMSPEQARGEGHRVDGRSDIFSLGIVLYELLTGRRPFKGDSREELLEQIASMDVRPLRQIDDSIPKELERICLKALSKRASERYTTAKDMADDLRYFLVAAPVVERSSIIVRETNEAGLPTPTPSAAPTFSDRQAVKIVPKGLRSFDATDANFFLELLPGPRDRDGLPESLRFWKTRIEEADPDQTFAVGLIYGPSGCGKSSLVKAGLLPRLAKSVTAVYVEATAKETEARLLKGLRRQVPDLPGNFSLVESLAALRQGRFLDRGRKMLLVLDQFEQWLYAGRREENAELVQALRQCDGGRVQCVVLVRDDFWLAVSRFMQALEVPVLEGENSRLVDLFDLRHARKVLTAFGRAFGALPESARSLTKDQNAFLDQAVAGLAQEGKVISVRLTVFAEMVKSKPWTPATLREVGGTAGVGMTFLEETFAASTAPPQHRLHQKAAQAVLKALLPEAGTDIKGHMRSYAQLLDASGYTSCPQDFEDLLHILDSEIRLITPTDPEGRAEADAALHPVEAGQKYYQLSHDYLVHSLRDWLTRKQRETRRGRAELSLAERAALWSSKPEKRFLPAAWEWLTLRLLTRRRDWTTSQREMMDRAAHYWGACGALVLAVLVLVLATGWEATGRLRAQVLRDRLLEAHTDDVPAVVQAMGPYRRWLDGPLREAYANAEANNDRRRQLHASLALLPVDPGQISYLCDRVLGANPQELLVIREALEPHAAEASARLWGVLEDPKRVPSERLRAACVLAAYAANDDRWQQVSRDVAARLVAEDVLVIVRWAEALRPVRQHLLAPLATLLVEDKRDAASRRMITRLYGDYAEGLPNAFAPLVKEIAEENGAVLPNERLVPERKQAIAAAALAALGQWEPALSLLRHTPDPTVRSYLIDRLGPGGADARRLESLLSDDQEVSVRRAALLALGEFDEDGLPLPMRERLAPRLVEMHRDHADAGIRGAAGWLLAQWERPNRLQETDRGLATGRPEGKRRWYINAQGQTFVLLPPGQFQRGKGKGRFQGRVDYPFALAAREVTVADFLRFRKDHRVLREYAPTDDCPVTGVSWYDAAAYCNWLSDRDGIPPEQRCYIPNAQGQYAEGMQVAPDFLRRSGYRLPTVLEWEYACRAGSVTRWSIGEADDLLNKYAWWFGNSSNRSHPVGTLRPNDLGLFDMHGNAWEWCQDQAGKRPANGLANPGGVITDAVNRTARGGAFGHGSPTATSSNEIGMSPGVRGGDLGFRTARTVR